MGSLMRALGTRLLISRTKQPSSRSIVTSIGTCFLSAGAMFAIFQLIVSWDQPILDQYAFRQTQTAISAYWILKGGPWLAYQTPILGVPWSIPFEFPLYQWFVAILARALPFLTLDQAGRIVSELFFFCCGWPIYRIICRLHPDKTLFYFVVGSLAFSPLYAFWSRSFMMESTVLFFSLWFVAAVAEFLEDQRRLLWVEIAVTATLAICVKVTTFYGFAIAGALLVLAALWSERSVINIHILLKKYVVLALAVVTSFVILLLWLHYSDLIKMQNPISMHLTGPALDTWNFGTLKQRLSSDLYDAMFVRAPSEAVGSWVIVIVTIALTAALVRGVDLRILASLAILYLLTFFTFTNVQIVHHYYQYANSIFLVSLVSYCLYLIVQRCPILGTSAIVLMVTWSLVTFANIYLPDMTRPGRQLQSELATYVRANTAPNSVFLAFGLAYDSEVPYYAERRAVLLPDGMVSPQLLNDIRSDPTSIVGRHEISLVLICPNDIATNPLTSAAYRDLVTSLTHLSTPVPVGYCESYAVSGHAPLG